MAATYVRITRDEIEGFFRHHALDWTPAQSGNELCYDHMVGNVTVRVSTAFSVDGATTRRKGTDAMRTHAFVEGVGGVVKSVVTKRTQNWSRNLAARIEEVVQLARFRAEDDAASDRPRLRHEPIRPEIHNGTYTVTNRGDSAHRTLKISTVLPDETKPPHHFKNQNSGRRTISLMTGPDNETSFTMVAWLTDGGFRMTQRFADNAGTRATVALMLDLAANGENSGYADRYELLVEGRCLRCNRKLTTPESIRTGIGPICAGR